MIHVHLLVITTCTVWPWCFQNLSHGYPRATKVYIHHPCIMEFQDHCIFIFRNFPYNNAFAWVVSKMTPAPVPSKKNAQPKTPGEAPGRSCRNCAAPAKLKSCHCTRHYGSVEILAGKKMYPWALACACFFLGGDDIFWGNCLRVWETKIWYCPIQVMCTRVRWLEFFFWVVLWGMKGRYTRELCYPVVWGL